MHDMGLSNSVGTNAYGDCAKNKMNAINLLRVLIKKICTK